MNRTCSLLAGVAALAGCAAVGPDYRAQEPKLPAQFSALAVQAPAEVEASWWQVFGDPMLDELIASTLAANRELQVAAARIREARALAGLAAAPGKPQASLNANPARERLSENGRFPLYAAENPATLYQGGFTASWEIDLFGGIARGREAAAAELERAGYDRDALQLALLTEVASSYFRLRSAQARRLSLEAQIEALSKAAALLESRARAGIGPALDAAQAREQLATMQARLPLIDAAFQGEALRLGVLTGRQASDWLARLGTAQALPEVPATPGALPASLLSRRPDLRAIERAAAAEHARIGVAESARYPSLSLGLSLGLLSISSAQIADAGSRNASAGANFALPLSRGGAIGANRDAALARYEEARWRYESAVANAVQDVELAAARLAQAQKRESGIAAALEAHALTEKLTRARYEQGLVDFLNVLDTLRQRYALDDDRNAAREAAVLEWIGLLKALGGGWRDEVREPLSKSIVSRAGLVQRFLNSARNS